MKATYKISGFIAALALYALVFAGCEKDLNGAAAPAINDGANSITITGIPPQYRSMEVRIMSGIDPYPCVEVACGYNEVNKGKAAIPLFDQNMEDWTSNILFKIPARKLILANSKPMMKAVQNRTGLPLQAYL